MSGTPVVPNLPTSPDQPSTSTPSPTVPQTPRPSIASAVSASLGKNVPKGISAVKMSGEESFDNFHVMLYGETDSFKTTTAAMFGGPERTLIITTRDPEQVRIPLRGLGFHDPILAEDSDALEWALLNPEKAAEVAGFPEWASRPDRVLMLDDATEGTALLVDDNSVKDDGSEVKDGRKIYGETKKEIRAILNSLKKKKINLVFTALADETDDAIFPAMPRGARMNMLAAFDYVFYMKRSNKKMVTTHDTAPYVKKDEKTGKPVTAVRAVFAKRKEPKSCVGRVPPLVNKEEPMDLASFWKKIQSAVK